MKIKLLTFFAAVVAVAFAIVLAPDTANAQDAEVQQENTTTQQNQENTNENNNNYVYIAQPGDSYSVLARKAIQTYGIDNNTELSGAQIIFAETNITQEAGSPILNDGQEVTISQETVKNWVDKAKELTEAQITLWDYYVPFVDFNTNSNGQAQA